MPSPPRAGEEAVCAPLQAHNSKHPAMLQTDQTFLHKV
jgi:hypothetical protein